MPNLYVVRHQRLHFQWIVTALLPNLHKTTLSSLLEGILESLAPLSPQQQTKVSVPSPEALAWDVCSMSHLETHFPMH
jgi:hypothetical protein